MERDEVDSAVVEEPGDPQPYGVKLEVFEGPLDLLLYLIRKDELDIYDIPIAHITAQYLAFLGEVHRLDLEQASGFILMAATLMKIKSQMLLPQPGGLEPEAGEDPRQELVRRLLEYQQFKEIAEWLGLQELARRGIYARRPGAEQPGEAGFRPVSLFDLLAAYKHVLDHVPVELVHRVVEEQVSVEECIEYVLALLERRSRLRFFDLVQGRPRLAMIATFMSLLELLKSQRIRVQQAQPFDDIWIEKGDAVPAGAPEAGAWIEKGDAAPAAAPGQDAAEDAGDEELGPAAQVEAGEAP